MYYRQSVPIPLPLICLLLVSPSLVLANMRAPVTLHKPSGALLPVKAGLTVERAELVLRCRQDCEITARYQISSLADCVTELTFILSNPDPIRASVNGSPTTVSTTAPFSPGHEIPSRNDLPRLEYSDDLYQASFPARLRAGDNRVTVNYRQQYGTDEKEFAGYFSGWRQLREIRYELWPLREWHLAHTFTTTVQSFFVPQKHGEMRLVHGYHNRETRARLLEKCTPVQEDRPFTRTWNTTFPGRIEWLLGPADLCDKAAAPLR